MDKEKQEELYKINADNTTGSMLKKISEKTARELREYAGSSDTGFIDEILSGSSKTKKTSQKKVIKLDEEVYEKYFSGMSEKQVSEIIEKALEIFFKNS